MLQYCVLVLGVSLSAVFGALIIPRDNKPVPLFPNAYTATGYVLLPYANLTEPFTAFYDQAKQSSRIDYYNQTMKTFQISSPYGNTQNGANFKIVWTPNRISDMPEQICYQANGTSPGSVAIQSVFPDLTDFKYVGEEDCQANSSSPELVRGGKCSKWTLTVTNFTRKNQLAFWAQDINGTWIPAHYNMLGFDSLFGSHFDQYEMVYNNYTPGSPNSNVFDAVNEAPAKKCVAYPDGSGLSTGHLFNPMAEFVRRDETHLHERFDDFKRAHDKSYVNQREESLRKNNFRHNQRMINSLNRKNKSYKLKINQLADLHSTEMKALRGRKFVASYNGGDKFPEERFVGKVLPEAIDWRNISGVVSPVKDQAICGSCWSFGTTGHLESMYFLKNKKAVDFSEQQLVDCSWNFGNGACDGGMDFQAYRYIMQYGLSTKDQYGPYLGIDGKCHEASRTISTLFGYINVTGIENLKKAVAYVGPISIGIDAAVASLSFYAEGIYDDPQCKNDLQDLDHAVLAVGYGTSADGRGYWIVKNSWSTHWGDQGYVKIAQKGNLCGVATQATYAILSDN